jgi:2-amino-4-hydroxy-6-hydroxymethyldihydropteridine diphosphokinase
MIRIYLGIGSNLGDRRDNCLKAVESLGNRGIKITKRSSFYETKPWGVKDQPDFINMVVEGLTDLTARELLETVKDIEREIGRTETYKWGPRVIDIDILLYGDKVIDEPDLKIPHPYMGERDFVLSPLAEIAPGIADAFVKKKRRC